MGVDNVGGWWAVMPILQNGSVFSFFSLYYTDIDYSTTGDPPLLPADLTKSVKINHLLWPPHPLSTVTQNP